MFSKALCFFAKLSIVWLEVKQNQQTCDLTIQHLKKVAKKSKNIVSKEITMTLQNKRTQKRRDNSVYHVLFALNTIIPIPKRHRLQKYP